MNDWGKQRFRLFVVGESLSGKRAMFNFRQFHKRFFDGEVELEVVDILQNPEQAEKDRIIAAPALVRVFPPPSFKIIGDLTDTAHLRTFFGLDKDGFDKEGEEDSHV
ncbi:MAG: circadian clock KaiB family protein [Magnetococcales bacterium]|nr:circadian clock KaiB family protein [Magnetococcales bacterium]